MNGPLVDCRVCGQYIVWLFRKELPFAAAWYARCGCGIRLWTAEPGGERWFHSHDIPVEEQAMAALAGIHGTWSW